jgi:hypothetical protein
MKRPTLIEKYRELRKSTHYGKRNWTSTTRAIDALSRAKDYLNGREGDIDKIWSRLEELHYVRIRFEPDYLSVDDVCGDCDARNCLRNGGTCGNESCHQLAKHCRCREPRYCHLCQSVVDTVNRDGLWLVVAEYSLHDCDCGPCTDATECRVPEHCWESADIIGGIIGTDDDICGYGHALKATCIASLKKALRERVRIRKSETAGRVVK